MSFATAWPKENYPTDQEHERLQETEQALDQYWDLLRQRRARREFGEDPNAVDARPIPEVENYQQ